MTSKAKAVKRLKIQTEILKFYKTLLSDDDNQMDYNSSFISSELKKVSRRKKSFD